MKVPEIAAVTNEFTAKYGKEFTQACLQNVLEEISVNEKLVHTMSIAAPPSNLVGECWHRIRRYSTSSDREGVANVT